jgi:alkaline phosphatase D
MTSKAASCARSGTAADSKARAILRNRHDAEDTAQQRFLRVLKVRTSSFKTEQDKPLIQTRLRSALTYILLALLLAVANLTAFAQRPYVVLVSLDGFRYDYAERYHAGNLLAIARAGAAAEGLMPVFPSVTFPNHISIVTGLYPEHHGIVDNAFYDPSRKDARYEMGTASRDGSWYRAKPLWVVAEEQQVKSATMFWPSSEAEILGFRPSYWKPFDRNFPNEQRVAQVLDWLKLPEQERPHLITLYIGDTDAAGHKYGPDAPETAEAVRRVDKLVGALWEGLKKLDLPINLIVVSDHGMQTVKGFINIDGFADLGKVRVLGGGVFLHIYAPDEKTSEETYKALKAHDRHFKVYRRRETPPGWHFSSDPRIGDLIVMAEGPNMIGAGLQHAEIRGEHGFDPALFPTMKGIFYAVGPNVKPGVTLRSFENIHIFPFITRILQLQNPAGLDGSDKVLADIYRP